MKNIKKIRVSVYSDSLYFPKSWYGGVHSAFLNHVKLLKHSPHLFDVQVNSFRKADIYHVHTLSPFAPLIVSMASPVVTTAHITGQSIAGSSKGYQYIAPIFNKYQRWYFNHSDLVFAVSPDSKKFLSTQGITPPIHVFPNPIDTTFFYNSDILREKGREYLKIRHDTFVVLSVGYFQTRKGIYDFIEVAKQHPQYTFVWVGGKSFGMSDVRLHTLPKNLLLVGTIPYSDLPEVYNAADLFFFPSYQENGSMAILEAAACGVPLLLRDLPSYKTLYKTGYAVGETIDEFVSKIQNLPQKIKRISMSHRSL